MKQPGFCQACEIAFAECGGAVKGYIVEEEVIINYHTPILFYNFRWNLNTLTYSFHLF